MDRVDELNSILIQLNDNRLHRLVENCLAKINLYSSVPFLFEIFIARWLLNNKISPDYEPETWSRKVRPDFTFAIGENNFVVSLKSILQISNEETKRNIKKEIKKRLGNPSPNIQIWLSPTIEANEINSLVGWIIEKAKSLSIGSDAQYFDEGETLATIKKLSDNQGKFIIEIIGASPPVDVLPQIDIQRVKGKLKRVLKKAYECFVSNEETTYNLLFLTTDSYVHSVKESLEVALLGTEQWVQHQGSSQLKFKRIPDGILSGEDFSKLDAIFFFHPRTDFLEEKFEPGVIVNPRKAEKCQSIPDPFKRFMGDFYKR